MKIYIHDETATAYWLEGDSLMFSPLPLSGTIDTERDGGEVDKVLMKDEQYADGKFFDVLYRNIEQKLYQN